MDNKLLLVKTITLLYCESICKQIQHRSDDLAQRVIQNLKIPEQIVERDLDRNAIVGLRDTLMWMMEQSEDTRFDYPGLLQRVRCYVGVDNEVISSFEETERYATLEDDDLVEVCQMLNKEIRYTLNKLSIREIIDQARKDVFNSKKPINLQNYVQDLIGKLESYTNGEEQDQKEFILNLVDMNDRQSLKHLLDTAREDNIEGGKGLITGWRAVNRMLGEKGMLRRGDFVLVGGLTNCYKSGFVHDLFRHFCLYNDPVAGDETKTPTLLYFSAENHIQDDITRMYIALKENETGEPVDMKAVDANQASEYVSQKLQQRGWRVAMIRIDPSDFTYMDLFNVVLQYESAGYEIHAIVFDYLALISRRGLSNTSMTGEDKRELMQKVRSFMASRNILFVTPHQLSQDANALKRQGVADFVQQVAGKNYWDGSKRIVNEVDLEIIVDIVDISNQSYLAVGRGKHRTVKVTPRKHRFFYLPFAPVGFVPEDIHLDESQERTVYDIGSAAGSDIDWD